MVGVALFAFSSGCVAYKPPPDVVHADNYTSESNQIQRTLPLAYKVMSVEDAVNISLANNTTYQKARLAMIKAWAAYYGSLNAFTPNIALNFGGSQAGKYGTTAAGSNIYQNAWTSGVAGTWNVFNGMQDMMSAMSQLASAKSAEELNKDARRILIQNVKLAYYTILQDKANIQINQSSEAYWQQMVSETQLKYDAGATSLSDLLNQKIQRNGAQVSLIQSRASYAVDRYAIAALLGLTSADIPDTVKFPNIDTLEDDKGYALGVEFYLNMAIKQRPDLQSSKELVKAAKYSLYQQWGAFSPTANLNWSYGSSSGGIASGPAGTNPYYSPTYTNTYGFTTAWTIWDGSSNGSRIMNVRQYQAAYDTAQESLLASWIEVVQDVRSSYTNLTSSLAQRKIYGATLSMSKQRRDLVTDEYNAGNCDITTLNQAQNQLVGDEQNYVSSVIGVIKNRAKLDAACGLRD